MADAKVSKTFDLNGRVGSTPTFGTTIPSSTYGFRITIYLSQRNGIYELTVDLTVTGISLCRGHHAFRWNQAWATKQDPNSQAENRFQAVHSL